MMKHNVTLTLILILAVLLSIRCTQQEAFHNYTEDEKKEIDRSFRGYRSPDSLKNHIMTLSERKPDYELVSAYRHLGRSYRNKAMFKEAIDAHKKGLDLALQICDTLEIIQAYNNLGTDYRRLGILQESSDFHYKALEYCTRYQDTTSYTTRKNRVVTLNGIGNIHLTLGNLDVADNAFRMALKGEQSLGSDLGMAINYANLGSIKEMQGQTDSAIVFYNLSMSHNQAAGSSLGIALCYNHFGQLAEKEGDYGKAYENYKNSYLVLDKGEDRWHWLESCVTFARINLEMGHLSEAEKYLREGKQVAENIHSFEHLNAIYDLISIYYEKRGDLNAAFQNYKKSIMYGDSLSINENRHHIQNLRMAYEREKSNAEIALAKEAFENEESKKQMLMYFLILIFLSSAAVIGLLVYVQSLRAKKNAVLKKTAKMQQVFFTNITHEFRTPLTVILGLAREISHSTDDPQKKEDMQTIIRQGNNLLELVNQLLDIAKIKSSIGSPDWHTGDITALARMTAENVNAFARSKGIEVGFVSERPEMEMDFVPDYMSKIFKNLLENAVKYTPENGQILFSIQQKGDDMSMVIADNGSGIPKEKLPYVFDPFYQAADSIRPDGNGIGLSMVKQMVETMNGTLTVHSIVGKGTTFTIHLPVHQGQKGFGKWIPEDGPLEIPEEHDLLQEEVRNEDITVQSSEGDEQQPVTILVVEDEPDVARYIGSVLKDIYSVKFARNGREGLEKAVEAVPDVILSDIMMPEMDGLEMFRQLKSSEIANHIPIIAITAKSAESDKLEILASGADAYLLKPFNSEELLIRIKHILEQRERYRQKFTEGMIEDESKISESDIPESSKVFLTNLNNRLYENLSNSSFSSDELADLMCMSRSQLNRKIKSITQFDTTSYIRQAKIMLAKKLLISTDKTIGEIMDDCGFEYRSYFNKVFKQAFDMTPAQYRKENR